MEADLDAKPPSEPRSELSTKDRKKLLREWLAEISAYEKDSEVWVNRSQKIIDRYRDSRKMRNQSFQIRYNILWANVQLLKPALYARDPIPRVQRRFKQKDPASRYGAQILERCLSYLMECGHFGNKMRSAVNDRLLPGRGVIWVRYVPTMKDVQVGTTDDDEPMYEEELAYEEALPDYIHWEDFGHTWARTWEEVRAVWRISYLTREELVKRFGDIGKDVPLTHSPYEEDKDKTSSQKTKSVDSQLKAPIYEIWDKDTNRAIWLAKEYKEGVLDVRDDPLELEDFFPCAKPIYATLSNDNLIPTPDYVQYQDQAQELDELTERISLIVKAVKIAGVYDASAKGIGRLLSEGAENKLIPVSGWAMFAEKGGLKGSMELLPVQQIAQTLVTLYQARDAVKNDIYEVTGLSDIVRGSTVASETATAQEIKSKYANLRLSETQKDVERLARDVLRLMADLIASKFDRKTLGMMSGVELVTEEQKQMILQGSNGQPPPEMQEILQRPTWEQVEKVLRPDNVRNFKIEVETDSTIAFNEEDEQKSVNQFMVSSGQFLGGLTQAVKEGVLDEAAGKKIFLEAIRRFRFTPEVEDVLESVGGGASKKQMEAIQQEMQKLEQQKKSMGDEIKAIQKSIEADKAQLMAQKSTIDSDVKAAMEKINQERQNLEQQKKDLGYEAKLAQKTIEVDKTQLDAQKTVMDANSRVAIAQIKSLVDKFMQQIEAPAEQAAQNKDAQSQQQLGQMVQQMQQIAQEAIQAVVMAAAPRTVDIVRDPVTGRAQKLVATQPQRAQ